MTSQVDYARTEATYLNRRDLSGLTLILVGAGALGNEVFRLLGLLGVGAVTIVDPDLIEPSNLTRSLFFRNSETREKARALAAAGTKLFTDTQWSCHVSEIADVSHGEIATCDAIIGCVDNDLARLEMSALSRKLDLLYIDAGLGGTDYWRGRVSVFPSTGACFACKLSPTRTRTLLQAAYAGNRSCWANIDSDQLPSTPVMASVTGALLVDIALKSIVQQQSIPSKPTDSFSVEVTLDASPQINKLAQPVSSTCPFHSARKHLVQAQRPDTTAQQLLDKSNGQYLELDWPICVEAQCQTCGTMWEPMKRTGWLRRKGTCPACRSAAFLENRNLKGIPKNSPWSYKPLIQLGLPELHWYSVA